MPTNSATEKFLALIQQYLGVPYVWGGSTPKGFDCSGLLQYAWGKEGVKIPRTSQQQWRAGMQVGKNALRPGDAVFFKGYTGGKGGPGHVGIYIGNGKFIEAPGRGKKVRVSLLASRSDYMGARRYSQAGEPLNLDAVATKAQPSQVVPNSGTVPDLAAEPQVAGSPPDPGSTIASPYTPGAIKAEVDTPNRMADTWQLLAADPLSSPETQRYAQQLGSLRAQNTSGV